MTFTIYTDSSGGISKWSETQPSVILRGGLFNIILGTVNPIFDTVFAGDGRWLQISVESENVEPRTRIVSTAYAMRVGTIDGASGGVIDGDLVADKGNLGDNNTNTGVVAFVAGQSNSVYGNYSSVSGGRQNIVTEWYGNISGGYDNIISEDYATIGGGYKNRANGDYSTIGGGKDNWASDLDATVAGGEFNRALAGYATVGGGLQDSATAMYATVGGGYRNKADGSRSTIGGGRYNRAGGNDAVVGGGA